MKKSNVRIFSKGCKNCCKTLINGEWLITSFHEGMPFIYKGQKVFLPVDKSISNYFEIIKDEDIEYVSYKGIN